MHSFLKHATSFVQLSISSSQPAFLLRSFVQNCVPKTRAKVLVLSGPTASGKSKIAFKLAELLNGEIINADSVKIYRGVNIGANKEVILNEMMTKNIPIHLIDIVDPTTLFSVADFYSHSRRITAEILSRGRVPIVVGGTPFYLRWYLRGPQECPKRDPALHARILEELLRENDWEKSLSRLRVVDPVYAESLSPGNYRRLARALEIITQTGRPLTNRHRTPPTHQQLDYDFRCFVVNPMPRDLLFRVIDERSERLIERGLLREVSDLLLTHNLPPDHPITTAIGYRHALQLYASPPITTKSFLHFLSTMQNATRQLAAQQLKWLRHEPIFDWIRLSLNSSESEDLFVNEVLHSFNLSEDEYHKRRTQQEYINEQNTLKTLSLEEKQRLYSYRAHLKVFCHKEKIQEQVMIATKYIERLTQQSTVVLSSVSSQKSQSSNHSIAS